MVVGGGGVHPSCLQLKMGWNLDKSKENLPQCGVLSLYMRVIGLVGGTQRTEREPTQTLGKLRAQGWESDPQTSHQEATAPTAAPPSCLQSNSRYDVVRNPSWSETASKKKPWKEKVSWSGWFKKNCHVCTSWIFKHTLLISRETPFEPRLHAGGRLIPCHLCIMAPASQPVSIQRHFMEVWVITLIFSKCAAAYLGLHVCASERMCVRPQDINTAQDITDRGTKCSSGRYLQWNLG